MTSRPPKAVPGQAPGRPVVTTHAEIEATAFRLFEERGFAATTVDSIATELGIGRRTFFRYFESKNDIPWGRFDLVLGGFRRLLHSAPPDVPLHEAVHRAVVAFNTYPADVQAQHRQRMRLILSTPALQAHSALRYEEWRRVIEQFVADRLGLGPGDLLPRTAGHVSLGLALAAYEVWLAQDGAEPLEALVDRAMTGLRDYLAAP